MKFLLFVLVAMLCAIAQAANGRGFSDEINWFNDLEKAKVAAKTEGKPLMVLIHKSWCGACTRLKSSFASPDAKLVLDRSDKFIMVNLENEEEPSGSDYTPDGGYIPRILFLDSNGKVRADIKDDARQKYSYFYSDVQSVARAMDNAISKL